jgi:hypothetical protein
MVFIRRSGLSEPRSGTGNRFPNRCLSEWNGHVAFISPTPSPGNICLVSCERHSDIAPLLHDGFSGGVRLGCQFRLVNFEVQAL